MALFRNMTYVNDGGSGSNGLSVVSAKGHLYKPSGGLYEAARNLFTTPDQRNFQDAYTQAVKDNYKENTEAGMAPGAAFANAIGFASGEPDLAPTPTQPTFSGSGKVQAKPITYSDWSDAAKYFGMDQATAYAEHMANTAHQREVADLRAAGLNPVLGLGSGASGVTGHSAASGGGSGSSARKTDSGTLIDVIGATVGFLASLKFGATAGNHASKVASGLAELFGKK